ncbi:alpha/beta fold hydrolase [Rhodococcus sp. NCIMB 12038]|uniref:alpha/beta fold hydrolase n=1 Tax=Rhodococcus sp. NCIMB 12038 TaxID=933800 RepID=UPI0001F48506|nr:alpha/beta hydrolase [Rhodococcus sp. NCIMB 12038]ADT78171.1 hydrolase, alpha/beta fold family protein [Rhodococcus sp. NCIMB 12038]OUS92847.1 hypothetical protein CA951_26285 [Rhodococcus sp. NCIMB 12038]
MLSHDEVIVFIHGLGSESSIWDHCRAQLSASLAPDLPGYAQEPRLAGPPSPSEYARHILAAYPELTERRIHVVGHSMGCLVAAAMASESSCRTATLTLVSPTFGFGRAPEHERRRIIADRMTPLRTRTPPEWARDNVDRLVDASAAPTTRARAETLGDLLHREGISDAVEMMSCSDLLAIVAEISCPLMVVYGQNDAITPADESIRRFGALRRPPDIQRVARSGHLLPVEAPAELAGHIRNHIQEEQQ